MFGRSRSSTEMPYEYSLYPRDFQVHQGPRIQSRYSIQRFSPRSLNERIASIQRALTPTGYRHTSSRATQRERLARVASASSLASAPNLDMISSHDDYYDDEQLDELEQLAPKTPTDTRPARRASEVPTEDLQRRYHLPSNIQVIGRTTPNHSPTAGRVDPSVRMSAGRSTPVQKPTPPRRPTFYSSPSQDGGALSDEDARPLDYSRRGIHIPSRTSSSNKGESAFMMRSPQRKPSQGNIGLPEQRLASSSASVLSYETQASSINTLPPLQAKGPGEGTYIDPLDEDDPRSFDLVAPGAEEAQWQFSLEKRSEQLFSRDHLQSIFDDPEILLRFTSFMTTKRPQSVPLLIYYLDALKALRAINYANIVAEALGPLPNQPFTEHPVRPTVNSVLEDKANQAFDELVREELPAFVTHTFVQVVTVSVQRRITGTLAPHLREASEGLAEVFCLTDVSRLDNPIVFASEEFHRTTQYGVNYAIGRNCRFLQGPRTDPHSVRRLRHAVEQQREISEVFLNYRRDGSPFMNLLMMAPLFDSRGKLRYYIGAQVDVSGLVKDSTNLEGMQKLLEKQAAEAAASAEIQNGEGHADHEHAGKGDKFQELVEMFNMSELNTVKKHGGRMHHPQVDDADEAPLPQRPRLLIRDAINDLAPKGFPRAAKVNGKLEGIYQHYLLVRPAPSLRILFTSPSLRVPGILQSPFLSRIGGSDRVRHELATAMQAGRGVTAKVRWLSASMLRSNTHNQTYQRQQHHNNYSQNASHNTNTNASANGNGATLASEDEGRPRWIHCTPLLGQNGSVGVWMVVLVDDEAHRPEHYRLRKAPPVAERIGGGRRGRNVGAGPLGKMEYEVMRDEEEVAVRDADGPGVVGDGESFLRGEGSLNSFAL